MVFEREPGVHDDCILIEIPEVVGVRELGHGVAHGGEGGPAVGDIADGVVGYVSNEDCVAYCCALVISLSSPLDSFASA